MMMRNALSALVLVALAACGGKTESLTIADASCRAPLVDGGTGAAYFSITSNIADRITGASSAAAEAVEIHESMAAGGMAAMHRVESVELPAGQTVVFGPGGLHLMLISPAATPSSATFPIHIALESGREASFDCSF